MNTLHFKAPAWQGPNMELPDTPSGVADSVSRAWYDGTIDEFLKCETYEIIGRLTHACGFPVLHTQSSTWRHEIDFLKSQLSGLTGRLFLEFNIPRMGRRIDAAILIGSVVFVIEFKVGEANFKRAAIEQVWDYALDLKNFHEASHSLSLVPILVATEATCAAPPNLVVDTDNVYRPIGVSGQMFRGVIDEALRVVAGDSLNGDRWASAPYRPTPTIIEAARSLYAQHSVAAIARHDAGARNLSVTSRRIEELVEDARRTNQKFICFVTGVPGAGKTLVGLNVATRRSGKDQTTHAVFLSGNGPLVAVLREALTRDEVVRQRGQGNAVRKGEVREKVKAFIQNVHHFRDEALEHPGPPDDHVVIFDEAQRAWNRTQTKLFMQRKKNRPGFDQSEPEFLISYMDRRSDWAVIVCLVGGGQEINTGEAGIDAWIEAVSTKYAHWRVFISSKLTESEYSAGAALDAIVNWRNVHFDDDLHLAVSMRSFRAENVSAFVKALLDLDKEQARSTFEQLSHRYPIFITRSLDAAKEWIRKRARGSERFGLVASSKAQRLKPHAIDIRVDVDPVHWFLNEREDTRSSYYLEDAATEFQVQGLELDWTCVTWDGDLRFTKAGWTFHQFRGDKWIHIKNEDGRKYLRNAYRVLLTRARQGMVIFIPPGSLTDATRSASQYDSTFEYFRELGIPEIG